MTREEFYLNVISNSEYKDAFEVCRGYIEELEAKNDKLYKSNQRLKTWGLHKRNDAHRFNNQVIKLEAKLKKYEEPVYAFDFDTCKIKGIESGTGREKGFENLKDANPIKVIIIEADNCSKSGTFICKNCSKELMVIEMEDDNTIEECPYCGTYNAVKADK